MQYLFSQAEDRFQLRDWGGYLCFLATADSAAARKFGVTAISRGSVTDASRRVGRKYKAELDPDNQ